MATLYYLDRPIAASEALVETLVIDSVFHAISASRPKWQTSS
jgi:hypothetical protein